MRLLCTPLDIALTRVGVRCKSRSVKTLPALFHAKGFNYRQLSRDGDIAVYEQTWGKSGSPAYETIIVQSHNGRTIHGTFCPPAEYFPPSTAWGVKGWTFTDRNLAFDKAIALTANRKSAVLTPESNQDAF